MSDGRYASVLLVGYGPFCLVRRHYSPKAPILNGEWVTNAVEQR
jgi:hypothetical protein